MEKGLRKTGSQEIAYPKTDNSLPVDSTCRCRLFHMAIYGGQAQTNEGGKQGHLIRYHHFRVQRT